VTVPARARDVPQIPWGNWGEPSLCPDSAAQSVSEDGYRVASGLVGAAPAEAEYHGAVPQVRCDHQDLAGTTSHRRQATSRDLAMCHSWTVLFADTPPHGTVIGSLSRELETLRCGGIPGAGTCALDRLGSCVHQNAAVGRLPGQAWREATPPRSERRGLVPSFAWLESGRRATGGHRIPPQSCHRVNSCRTLREVPQMRG